MFSQPCFLSQLPVECIGSAMGIDVGSIHSQGAAEKDLHMLHNFMHYVVWAFDIRKTAWQT